jgi:hypothetical protein
MNRIFYSGITVLLAVMTSFFAPAAFSADVMRVEGAPVVSTKAEAIVAWRSAADSKTTAAIMFRPLPAAALKSVQEENSQGIDSNQGRTLQAKRLKIGIDRNADTETDADTLPSLTWQNNGDGYMARWAVTSPDARGLRAGLQIHALPDSAELRFSGSAAPERIIGVVSGQEAKALRIEDQIYWTPLTEGETQTIEIWLPSSVKTEDVKIELNAVSHLFTSARDGFSATPVLKSEYCEVDVACLFTNLGSAFQNVSSAVAKITFKSGSGSSMCSGTLLNNSAGGQIPYFWTAAHCIKTSSEAATLNTYWFFELASCGGAQASVNYRQLTGGAALLYASAATDVSLLKLNNSAPAGAYFAGWDAGDFSADSMIGIHHPGGDYKKISIGKGAGATCDAVFDGAGGGVSLANLSLVSWSQGTTEGGSSGSGLFTKANDNWYLRGGLYGGSGNCLNSGLPITSVVDNTINGDCYSKLSLVYDSVKQWLAPSGVASLGIGPPTSPATLPPPTLSGFTIATSSVPAANATFKVTSNQDADAWWRVILNGASCLSAGASGYVKGGTMTGGTPFTGALGTLNEGASYMFCFFAANVNGNSAVWAQAFTTTPPPPTSPPTLSGFTIAASSVPITGATFKVTSNQPADAWWQVIPNGTSCPPTDVTGYVKGGTMTAIKPFTGALGTLNADSGYLFCFFAQNTNGLQSAVWSQAFTTASSPTPVTPPAPITTYGPTHRYDGQWIKINSGANDENAWGLTILMGFPNNANYIFVPWYTYDKDGKAAWYIFQGDVWSANDKITLDVYRYTGSPWGRTPYDNNISGDNFKTKAGTATLTFTSATTATFFYDVDGASRTINIAPIDNVPLNSDAYTGQWASASEDAWGLTVLRGFQSNPNCLFVPWYTYDKDGKAVWYIFQNDHMDGNTASAEVFHLTGPKWGTSWNDGSVEKTKVGTAKLTFTSTTKATFEYDVDGSNRSVDLQKLQ